MDEGYILSNKFRKLIFEDIASGEEDINTISKKKHIPLKVARDIVEDMVKNGILERKEDRYHLSKEGEKLAERLRNR